MLQKAEDSLAVLVTELVDTNGVIKPCKDGTAYTFAHRTIQEYLAAREAERTYTPERILTLSDHDHLIEVAYFYCGLIKNIPQLDQIAAAFIDRGKVIEAGRCVLNMPEPPDAGLIGRISDALLARIRAALQGDRMGNQALDAPLEVLSSLAQRDHPAFARAKAAFNEAIDRLAGSGEGAEAGASALESVLSAAANTTLARKLIPGLLRHDAPHWRRVAVSLLRDMDSDESLDELVRLLRPGGDPMVRAEAAKALAKLLKSRGEELSKRAVLLPKRVAPKVDRKIWPFEQHFPGRLVLPMAEAVDSSGIPSF
uniref:HEAT repeat-containing protein n=1 Tax=Candidatus Kentrum sp. FM TaxID=2126340 RepID=A0A450W3J7_9GAMM|nr:MAG: HEAT repeat-containing protein [Candidatus Kentron sp. FM]VFJ57793.1 MAG: HEAT repeat-containing protein [Candidatus Kentron sp. FM]VFK11601.1 MAG: HEAT repeat-containing protein [Candidatus Kentron sp. FM]